MRLTSDRLVGLPRPAPAGLAVRDSARPLGGLGSARLALPWPLPDPDEHRRPAGVRRHLRVRPQPRARRAPPPGRGALRRSRAHVQGPPPERADRVPAPPRPRRLHPRQPRDDLDRDRARPAPARAPAGRCSPACSPSPRWSSRSSSRCSSGSATSFSSTCSARSGSSSSAPRYHVFTTDGRASRLAGAEPLHGRARDPGHRRVRLPLGAREPPRPPPQVPRRRA